MKITLNKDTLNSIDMKAVWSYPYVNHRSSALEGCGEWSNSAGHQHYRLLVYLSNLYHNTRLADIGTSSGGSGLALAANSNNLVYSLDRTNWRDQNIPNTLENITFTVGDFHQSEIMDEIVKSELISLDIQHEGPDEIYFYNELVRRDWKGVLLVDDIHLNGNMKSFWASITHPKHDVSSYGHGMHSGTGLVFFSDHTLELQ